MNRPKRPLHEIVAYSAMEDAELFEYANAIKKTNPDLTVRFERMSTASLLNRLISDGFNGDWDVIFGWALTTMLDARILPLFGRLPPSILNALPRTSQNPTQCWFCPSAFLPAFCLNKDRIIARHLPTPTSWGDLAAPCFRGEIVLADPNYSGAGFLHLTALLQSLGEGETWKLMHSIAKNHPRIERSALSPCTIAANGEAAVGVTVTTAVKRVVQLGMSVHLVIPSDASGSEPEGFAVRAGSPRRGNALRALRWMVTHDASLIYEKYGKISLVSNEGTTAIQPTENFFSIDIEKAIISRSVVCNRWTEIFSPETPRANS
jgi:iron(III) transport system substrate-binding protein